MDEHSQEKAANYLTNIHRNTEDHRSNFRSILLFKAERVHVE